MSNASGCPQVRGQLDLQQLVVDLLLLRLRQHAGRQIDAGQPARIRRHERPAQAGAAAGVEHVEALRRPRGPHPPASPPPAPAPGRRASPASTRSSRRSCRRSARRSRSEARAGTSRPVHAASMWRAIGSSGSSASHSSKIRIALSTSPSVQCASASSRRASGCFGRSVIALQKQATASSVRFSPFSRTPRFVYASMCSGFEPDRGPIRGFGLDRLAGRPQQHAEVAVGIGVPGIERDRAVIGRDRLVQPAALLEDDAEIAVPVGPVRERAPGSSRSARSPSLAAPALVREHAGIVQRPRVVGLPRRESGGRRRRPRRGGPAAGAGSRSRAPRPRSARASARLDPPRASGRAGPACAHQAYRRPIRPDAAPWPSGVTRIDSRSRRSPPPAAPPSASPLPSSASGTRG